MNTLKSSSIKTKKDLYAFYLDQMSKDMIGTEIGDILKNTRAKVTTKNYEFAKIITLKEVVIFIANNDAPAGYILDDEMQKRVDEYKRIYALNK